MCYLRAVTRDADLADDLFQEFAVKLVRGEFHAADPDRGRFRNLVKRVLHNLVADHRRRRAAQTLDPFGPTLAAVAAPPDDTLANAAYLAACRTDLLDRGWERLKRVRGKPLYAVLAMRAAEPAVRSAEIAQRLSDTQGRAVSDGQVRKWLLQARRLLTDGIVADVAATLDPVTPERLADELAVLTLLDDCRQALDRWQAGQK